MVSWHLETDVIALLLFVVMLIRNINETRDNTLQHKLFFMLLILSMISAGIDCLSAIALNLHNSWVFCDVTLTLFMMTIPMLSLVWYYYSFALMDKRSDEQKLRFMKLITIPYAIYIVIAATNPWNHWFFKLTEDMVYSRASLYYYLGISLMLIYSIMSIAVLIRGCNNFTSKSDGILLIIIFAMAASSICLEALIPGLLIVRVAYAVLYTFCSMTVESERRENLYKQLDEQNESLKEAVEDARQANQAKNDFLSRMSHDIRTPMNGIIGMTRIALQQENPPKTSECLDNISTSSKFLLSLINDILDIQKVDSGSMELHPKPYLIADFNADLDSIIKPLYEAKHQVFHVESEYLENVVPIIDELRFNQIVFNLLSNAVKYTQQGGEISLKISNELAPNHKELITIIVSDNGMGMSKEFQKVIFEDFSQESRDVQEEIQGTGLGLSIVKKIVDLMGGTIVVESEIKQGTKFTVAIPFDYIDADQADWHESDNTVKDYSKLEGKHILVCEDNAINMQIAKALLHEKGIAAEPAANGEIGFQTYSFAEPFTYDMILTDIRMPAMNGYELAENVRNSGRADCLTIPIVAMTGDAFADDVLKCTEAGMNGHVAKPIVPEDLYNKLMEFLA